MGCGELRRVRRLEEGGGRYCDFDEWTAGGEVYQEEPPLG